MKTTPIPGGDPTTPASGDELALSDEQIGACIDKVNLTSEYGTHHFGWHMQFARAIEAEVRRVIAADRAARQAPVVPAGEPVVTVKRGARTPWGYAGVVVLWGPGLQDLPPGLHQLYAAPAAPLQQAQDGERDVPEQDPEMLAAMQESNTWHFVDDVVPILKAAKAGKWHWFDNTRCKYIELRIDMRDLGCLIRDRERVRISPATLAYQYSKDGAIQSDAARKEGEKG